MPLLCLSLNLSLVYECEFPLTRGWGGASAPPEPSVPGRMQGARAESTVLQEPFALDGFSDPIAVNRFGSLLLFLIVCGGLYGVL